MGSASRAKELSLKELESLLLEKRRRLARYKVRRFVAAEKACQGLGRRSPEDPEERPFPMPETWRGAQGQDRYFQPGRFAPLEKNASRKGKRSKGALLLLAIEIAALVGFLGIFASLYLRLKPLRRPQTIPTPSTVMATHAILVEAKEPLPTSTPLRLLPGGRPTGMPVSQGDQSSEPTRALTLSLAEPTPPPPGKPAQRLVIPKIGVEAPVVEGDTWEDLKKGIGHHPGSANPGEKGNMVVSAHNDAYGEIFRDLDKLEPGDEVLVYTEEGAYRYIVNRVEIVSPDRVEFMDPTEHPVLTMITCYPYLLDTHRVVVIADLAE
ncbi:MAG: class D sortase [Anaerolineae bacterium]|nr:class D sortase [Anaerolineae bacterium]